MSRLTFPAANAGRCASGVAALAFSVLFLAAGLLASHPDWFERPLKTAIHGLPAEEGVASKSAAALAASDVEGLIVLSLIWACWFSDIGYEGRARLAAGAVAAVAAGVSALVVHNLLRLLSGSGAAFVSFARFPSERATMFAGLAIALFLIRPSLGSMALGAVMIVEFSRIVLGFHQLTEILGSFFLAGAIVNAAGMGWGTNLGRWLLDWREASAALFYMSAWAATFEMATAFQDIRSLIRALLQCL